MSLQPFDSVVVVVYLVQPAKQIYITCNYINENIPTLHMLFSSQPAEAYNALSVCVVYYL